MVWNSRWKSEDVEFDLGTPREGLRSDLYSMANTTRCHMLLNSFIVPDYPFRDLSAKHFLRVWKPHFDSRIPKRPLLDTNSALLPSMVGNALLDEVRLSGAVTCQAQRVTSVLRKHKLLPSVKKFLPASVLIIPSSLYLELVHCTTTTLDVPSWRNDVPYS